MAAPPPGGAPVEELRHLAQANVSMDIDTFTNLNPRVLQVGPGAARQGVGRGWPNRGAQSQRRAGLARPQAASPGSFCRSYPCPRAKP